MISSVIVSKTLQILRSFRKNVSWKLMEMIPADLSDEQKLT